MTVNDVAPQTTGTPKTLNGPALWPAQAHTPSILGRQLVIERAEGSWLHTTEGQKLFDGTAGLWHANIGHSHPEMAQAAYDQMMKLETYHIFARYSNDQALQLGEKLAAISPIDNAKVILNSGGSDAIDVACKLARRHWQREGRGSKKIILSREFAYHGLHAYGTSIAGLEFNREGYGTDSLVPETARISFNDPVQVEEVINRIGAENIAALVSEPVQGTGGVNPPAPGYSEAISKLCRDNDILLILDEVITGFGRMGTMFAAEYYSIEPDMITFAKGVTSGYAPLGGVMVAPRLWEPFYEDSSDTPIFRHGATYAGHATASAIALKHMEILEREQLVPRVAELETVLSDALKALEARVGAVTEVRSAGLLGGVTLDASLSADQICDDLVKLGFISRPLRGNTLQISPPFIITDAELHNLIDAIGFAISERSDA